MNLYDENLQNIFNRAKNGDVIDFGLRVVQNPLYISNKNNLTLRGTLIGGVSTTEWTPLQTNDPLYSRIRTNRQVWTATARLPGANPFGTVGAMAWGNAIFKRDTNLFPMLLWNNKLMTLANSKAITSNNLTGYGTGGASSGSTTLLNYADETVETYANIVGLCVNGYFNETWVSEMRSVSAINTSINQLTCSPTSYSTPQFTNARFYYVNIIEELTNNGEYYIDRHGAAGGLGVYGRIYFIPPDNVDPNDFPSYVTYSSSANPLITASNCNDMIFEVNMYGGQNGGLWTTTNANPAQKCDGLTVRNCVASGMSRLPFNLKGSNITVDNVSIDSSMDTNIFLESGELKELINGNSSITNCKFTNTTPMDINNTGGVNLKGCGITIADSLFKVGSGCALRFEGCNITCLNNEFDTVMTTLQDGAAIYWGRNPSWHNILIKDCVFKNMRNGFNTGVFNGNSGKFTACIYADDGAGNAIIDNCVFGNLDRGIHMNGGRNLSLRNCTFNNCMIAWRIDGALMTWGRWAANYHPMTPSADLKNITCNQSVYTAGAGGTITILPLPSLPASGPANLDAFSEIFFTNEDKIISNWQTANAGATTLQVSTTTQTPGPIFLNSVGKSGGTWGYTSKFHSSAINIAKYLIAEPKLAVYFPGAALNDYRNPAWNEAIDCTFNACNYEILLSNMGTATFNRVDSVVV
jgi:parallel beta-helix repeat protein